MKNVKKILQKRSVQIALLGITIQTTGGQLQASASTLSPETIINTWTQGPEVVYGLKGNGFSPSNKTDIWGVDNSKNAALEKPPFNAITNHKERIGKSSKDDTEQYGSLVSDFSLSGDFTFSGSFFMPNDNDIVGLLFGYQDPNNHYRLSWGVGGTQRGWDANGKKIDQGPYERLDLPRGNPNEPGSRGMILVKEKDGVSTFFENTFNFDLGWKTDVVYDFSVRRVNENLFIDITQGATSAFSTMVTDTTFMSGKVGFNTAGVEVFYGNIVAVENRSAVPEPLTMLGSGLAMGFGVFFKRKLAQKSS